MTTEITVRGERQELVFTKEQRAILRDSFANGASESEFAVLMEVASQRCLNPFTRQIFFVKRWDGDKHREVWSPQVSIDGLRAIAERTSLYGGQDEPEFVEGAGDGAFPVLCKVRVYRKDWPRPAVGVAYWSEYVQTTRDKQTGKTRPNAMWAKMPHAMLSKCAEALALRKAFPEECSGLYTDDEMGQASNERPAATLVNVEVRREAHADPALPAPVATVEAEPTTEAPAAPQADAHEGTFRALRATLEASVKDRPVEAALPALVTAWRGMGATIKTLPEDVRRGLQTVVRELAASKWGTTGEKASSWLRAALAMPANEPVPLPVKTSQSETLPDPDAIRKHYESKIKSRKHLENCAKVHGYHPWVRPVLIDQGVSILEADRSDVAITIDGWAMQGREEAA